MQYKEGQHYLPEFEVVGKIPQGRIFLRHGYLLNTNLIRHEILEPKVPKSDHQLYIEAEENRKNPLAGLANAFREGPRKVIDTYYTQNMMLLHLYRFSIVRDPTLTCKDAQLAVTELENEEKKPNNIIDLEFLCETQFDFAHTTVEMIQKTNNPAYLRRRKEDYVGKSNQTRVDFRVDFSTGTAINRPYIFSMSNTEYFDFQENRNRKIPANTRAMQASHLGVIAQYFKSKGLTLPHSGDYTCDDKNPYTEYERSVFNDLEQAGKAQQVMIGGALRWQLVTPES
jgi:hypothetical protein